MTDTRRAPRSDDALRTLYAGTSAADDHPSEDALTSLLAHGATSDERERVVDHVSRCGECAEFLQHLARCAECPPEAGLKPVTQGSRPVRPWALWGGLAAAAAVAAILVSPPVPTITAPKPDPEALRGGGTDALTPLAPLGAQTNPPAAFQWRVLPEALAYRVVVRDARGDQVFASPALSGTSCPWPTGQSFPPGSYTWQVTARLKSGGEDSVSPLAHFALK